MTDATPHKPAEALWLSVSEAAKIAGVGTKTIRRAIEAAAIKFRVVGNRYSILFPSLLAYLFRSTKLRNKFQRQGLGRYVETWKTDAHT